MSVLQIIVLIAALALGGGTVRHAEAPEQVLVDGTQPRTPTDSDLWWCRPPRDFPREIMLVVGDTCWVELNTTQAECAALKR
jgi:hypothetical protein